MESQEAGFSPFPHSLEIPSGLPHSHGLGCWHISRCKTMRDRIQGLLDLKGGVTDVLGPKCNGCSGTLTPLRVLGLHLLFRRSGPEWRTRISPRMELQSVGIVAHQKAGSGVRAITPSLADKIDQLECVSTSFLRRLMRRTECPLLLRGVCSARKYSPTSAERERSIWEPQCAHLTTSRFQASAASGLGKNSY